MVNDSMSSPNMAANHSLFDTSLPPLPDYELTLQSDMLLFISDFWLNLIAPIIVYWTMSMMFHLVDTLDLFPQYRLHTPEEITKRNHVSRYEVLRDVIIQHIIQVLGGAVLSLTEPPEMTGKDEYNVAVWATRLRLSQRILPGLLSLVGLNATAISKNMATSHPILAGALAGGYYPFLTTDAHVPSFAPWELMFAKFIYWVAIPAVQLFIGVAFLDTWQYFLHRLMHMNKWMYTTFHSRHHRLYVPYAYGALYNHPFEGFLLDTLGAAIAFKIAGMTLRQGMFFFCFSSMKTVDDHCGYAFPWDPLQAITSNNAAYHDIHHQTWGIKTNFSQPWFTFWDGLLGTKYEGKRTDRLADKKREQEKAAARAK
ncbi:sphinganine C4-monooxygenase [Emericellopsis cladophorae]|uniref:Sphinganine C4-monooxygenase n=1 Tax=Emericellopsis cladophorae TaxID=2686198 RepID=A0A9P9XWJ2_9HYPO|nr:sphinganine C4-monooxygenase [Emericellopsis cladophorae]KAI6779173.1 sphinganine C4-monooxygenase [Emericellopsis cladophorae]